MVKKLKTFFDGKISSKVKIHGCVLLKMVPCSTFPRFSNGVPFSSRALFLKILHFFFLGFSFDAIFSKLVLASWQEQKLTLLQKQSCGGCRTIKTKAINVLLMFRSFQFCNQVCLPDQFMGAFWQIGNELATIPTFKLQNVKMYSIFFLKSFLFFCFPSKNNRRVTMKHTIIFPPKTRDKKCFQLIFLKPF